MPLLTPEILKAQYLRVPIDRLWCSLTVLGWTGFISAQFANSNDTSVVLEMNLSLSIPFTANGDRLFVSKIDSTVADSLGVQPAIALWYCITEG